MLGVTPRQRYKGADRTGASPIATTTAPRSGTRRRPRSAARSQPTGAGRIASLDAFRGLAVAAVLLGLAAGELHALPELFHPAPWHGFRPADLVAPALLVSSGAALAATRARHRRGKDAVLRLSRRVAVLVAVAGAILWLDGRDPMSLDPTEPLPRLAIAWLAVWALTALPRWGQIVAAATLLAAHWLALGRFDAAVVDDLVPLLTIAVTVLAGYWFGDWLRSRPAGPATAVATVLSGVYIGAAGVVVAQVLPLNRTLWTPTFVLFGVGATLVLFAGVYTLVTVLPLGRSLSRLTRLGRHAFVAYVAVAATTAALGAGERGSTWTRLQDGFGAAFGDQLGALLLAVGVVLLAVGLVGAVDRRGWYLRP